MRGFYRRRYALKDGVQIILIGRAEVGEERRRVIFLKKAQIGHGYVSGEEQLERVEHHQRQQIYSNGRIAP